MYLENQPQNLQMQQESQIQVSFCKVNTAHSPYTTLVLALETESNNVLNNYISKLTIKRKFIY